MGALQLAHTIVYDEVCARRIPFLRRAQAVIWTSVLIFWRITIMTVKADRIVTGDEA
jgi:hypothetical protein